MADAVEKDIRAINSIDAVPAILDVICRITGMGFVAIARVTETRWIACSVRDDIQFGLKAGGELELETTICDEIRQSRRAVVIDHVANDETFASHHTPAKYGFQSYISMPIILGDGAFFGTLCAIDPKPAKLNTPEIIGTFKLFAELIALHLSALDRAASTEAKLIEERQISEVREQFIAVLGHDLRNPLNAINGGAHLLLKSGLPERPAAIASMILSSSARMAELIKNVMDFARTRLGSGVSLASRPTFLEPVLGHVVDELKSAKPDRDIECDILLPLPVACDPDRLSQLLSNLLANALTHGAADSVVYVRAASDQKHFELSVSNSGTPIPADAIKRLFKPFTRENSQSFQQGLGLGLYIAAEVARAHGGELSATSTVEETRFTFRMPLAR